MATLRDFTGRERRDEAKLLQRRMSLLGLDVEAWAHYEPADLLDLESACASCESRQRCANDLLEHTDGRAWADWRRYCPIRAKLEVLVAQTSAS